MANSTSRCTIEAVGERIRVLREKSGLSQKRLGEALGLHYTAISHVEAGRRALSYEPLVKAADALGCSVDYLLGRTEVA